MDEASLLRFRWGGKEYGVPVGGIQGIIGKAGALFCQDEEARKGGTNPAQEAIPVVEFPARPTAMDSKSVVLLQANGVQIGLIVDEIIGIDNRGLAGQHGAFHKTEFEIWRMASSTDENGRQARVCGELAAEKTERSEKKDGQYATGGVPDRARGIRDTD